MKKLLSTLALATVLTTSAQAGAVVDLKVGYDYYPGMSPTGSINGTDVPTLFGISGSGQSSLYVEFEHLIPVIPNIKYEQNTLNYTGTAGLTGTFGGQTITASAASAYAWDNQDVILYWGVPFSTWIPMIDAADFGFGAKLGDLAFGIDGVSSTSFIMPAIYGYARIHVTPPMLFGIGFEVEVKALSATYEGNTISFSENIYKMDWMVEAPIPVIDLAVGLELGYRNTATVITAGGASFDLGFSGVFFGVVGKFGI